MNILLVSILLFFGSVFILIASIGLVRFKDLYSRMHATTKATSFGILLLLLGISIYFNSWNVAIKVVLIINLIYFTAPLAAHSIAKSYEDKKDKE
ncbi:MAG: monovalent cation/H(+) antiporter subunit G [Bacteroidales bacterium]|nr:monovalent cation/H(+) antiporter subunit G [Bacteroidales bacterium]